MPERPMTVGTVLDTIEKDPGNSRRKNAHTLNEYNWRVWKM